MSLALREQGGKGPGLTPAGQACQQAWERVQRLQGQLAQMETAAQAHQTAMAHLLHPWRAAYRAHLAAVAGVLDTVVQNGGEGLSATQRRTALAAARAYAQALKPMAPAEPQGPPEDHGVEDAQAARRAARQARREKRETRRQSAAGDKAGTAGAPGASATQATLRELYRQLASALHPDREAEGPLRDRKTALMGEANVAYQSQDMATLLRLQQTVLQASAGPTGPAAEQRLQAQARLLQQQAAGLDRQRQLQQQRWWATLGLTHGTPLTAEHLALVLARAQAEHAAHQQTMAQERTQLADLSGLKAWLNGWRERWAVAPI